MSLPLETILAPTTTSRRPAFARLGATAVVGAAVFAALVGIFWVAPEESTMGPAQRIVYLHVASAWSSLCGSLALGLLGLLYLGGGHRRWDRAAQAAAEIAWLCSSLTLATGSLWAHSAWGTWWTWDPRLTTTLILWLLLAGYFLVRGAIDEPQRRARISAVLALLATADVPMVILATRWFRGIHPVTPAMDPRMRWVLLISVLAFGTLFLFLGIMRWRQLNQVEKLVDDELDASYDTLERPPCRT